MGILQLRWADVDPATHPFDEHALRDAVRDVPETARRNAFVRHVGLWAIGFLWEVGEGGPVRWEAEDWTMRALVDWRGYIEEVAAVFAAMPRADVETGIETVALRVLPIILARNVEAEKSWWETLATTVSWYVESAQLSERDLRRALSEAASYQFSPFVVPDAEAAARGCRGIAAYAAASKPDPMPDGIRGWQHMRGDVLEMFLKQDNEFPVSGDGHVRYVDEVDRARDSAEADRIHAALLLCSDSAKRGMALTFDQLAEWHAVVRGASEPSAPRQSELRDDRAVYPLRPDLAALVADALDDAYRVEPPAVSRKTIGTRMSATKRAARLYLDLCFLQPFDEANEIAARFALDHRLACDGLALQDVAPIVAFGRIVQSRDDARTFAALVCDLAGPTSPR